MGQNRYSINFTDKLQIENMERIHGNIFTNNRDNDYNARDRITAPPIIRDEVNKANHVARNKRA